MGELSGGGDVLQGSRPPGELSYGGVVLRGRRPPGESSSGESSPGGVVLRGSCQVGVIPGAVVLEPLEYDCLFILTIYVFTNVIPVLKNEMKMAFFVKTSLGGSYPFIMDLRKASFSGDL